MVNYTNAKVYLIEPIEEHDKGDIYIGCTTEKFLSNRMNAYRNNYKCFKNGKSNFITVFSLFDKFGVENCKISLIESVNCLSRDELLQKEGFYIRTLPCVNKCISGRNQKEYYQDNKKQILEYQKEYSDLNKEKINQYQKQYRDENKEYFKHYYQDNKNQILEYNKQYYDDNKAKINEYQKQYRDDNKEKLNEYKNEKNNCICGGNYTNTNKQHHLRTYKHKFFIDYELWKYKNADVMHQMFNSQLFFNCYCKSESII